MVMFELSQNAYDYDFRMPDVIVDPPGVQYYWYPCHRCSPIPCGGHHMTTGAEDPAPTPTPTPTGWQCPGCRKFHSPSTVTCPIC